MADDEKKDEIVDENEEQKNIHADNEITIEDSGPCRKRINVEIPEKTIKASLDEQFQDIKRDAAIPGFRKGRAPLRLVEKRFGNEIGLQVKLKLLADASQAAVDANDLDLLGDPDIDHENIELPETGPLKFDFEVEVRPHFELPELEGIKVEKAKVEVTDEKIDEEIMAMRKRSGVWSPKEGGVVEKEDQIIADVVMVIDGVEEHEKLDNTEIFVRETGFVGGVPVDGLDKLLVKAKAGDEKKISVDVPKTYFNEQYRGKKIDIEITVKDIKKLDAAELTPEFLERFGVDSEDDLREKMIEMHSAQAEKEARSAMADQVYQHLLEKIDLDLPESIVADQSTQILQRQYTNLLMKGLQKEQLDEQMQELRASSEEQAEEQLKLFFVMDKVAEKLDISTTEEEINGHIAQIAAQRNRRPEKVREELAKDGSLAQFSLQVREQKCVEKILESAQIVEVKEVTKKKKAVKKAVKKPVKKAEKAEKKDEKPVKKAEDKVEKPVKKAVKKVAKKDSKDEKVTRAKTATKRKKKSDD